MLGMGPVAAPHEPVGRVGVQQQPGGFTAGPRTVRRRPVAIGRRQLDPDLAAVGLAQQIGEAGVGDAQGRVRAAEVVDDHAAAGGQQGRHDSGQAARLQMHFHMPAQRVDVRQQFLPGGLVQRGQGQADQVEPDAGHAGLGQRQQIRRRDVGRHHGDPRSRPAARSAATRWLLSVPRKLGCTSTPRATPCASSKARYCVSVAS